MGTESIGSQSCRHYQYRHAHAQQYAYKAASISTVVTVSYRYSPFCRHLYYCPRMRRIWQTVHGCNARLLNKRKQTETNGFLAAKPQLLHWRQSRLIPLGRGRGGSRGRRCDQRGRRGAGALNGSPARCSANCRHGLRGPSHQLA